MMCNLYNNYTLFKPLIQILLREVGAPRFCQNASEGGAHILPTSLPPPKGTGQLIAYPTRPWTGQLVIKSTRIYLKS